MNHEVLFALDMSMRPRGSVAASDSDNVDNNGRRRQPFRPLQPLRTSRSPTQPTLKSTPPREVILTPRATPKPIKRKATSRHKRVAAKVKSEPPEINLSKVRPPSPSDDPLLLSGTPSTRSPPLRARFTPAFSSSPTGSAYADPPVSFVARLSGARITDSARAASSSQDGIHALSLFSAPRTVEDPSGGWSDSDDDGFNLAGEYTGKFKILKVPTKADPPTREHLESWGRPVSPFPYSAIMERSLPLSEVAEDDGGREAIFDSMMPCGDLEMDEWEAATEPPPSDVEHSPPPSISEDEFADLDDDFPVFDVDAESTQVRPLVEPRDDVATSDQTVLEEQEEEERIDRELSVVADDGPDILSKAAQPVGSMEDDSSEEEDDVDGEDIIKITSEDPKAAARAAAILRMHDYDCILAAERKKRFGRSTKSTRKRRKTIENAGISKSYADLGSQPWKALQGCETSPGSRSLPLLELWRDAEDSVFLEHHSMSYCDTSFTLSPLKAMTSRPPPLLPPPGGEWNRDCWKCLDKCLAAERLAVAASRGLGTNVFADMGDISKDAVLVRFKNQLGGESVLAGLGSDWSRDNLILRLDVLLRKQSRHMTRPPLFKRQGVLDVTEPRYRGLLQEAIALSETLERCPTSTSISSDTTVIPERPDVRKTLPDQSEYPEPSWQTGWSRGPIRTPSRTPDPGLPHPKDQVHLRHASVPQKSMIPVPIRPKRLVDLRHLSPVKGDRGIWRPTARRSSGCSVMELVRQFESLDK